MRQDGTAHENGNLLHDLDTGMSGLPGFLTLTHRLQEGQQGWDTQGRCYHGKGTGGGVTHVLVQVVNVGTHGGDHGGEAGGFGEIGDDLTAFNAGVVILVDQQGLYDHKNLCVGKIGARSVM